MSPDAQRAALPAPSAVLRSGGLPGAADPVAGAMSFPAAPQGPVSISEGGQRPSSGPGSADATPSQT
jgi:hypothetical protein